MSGIVVPLISYAPENPQTKPLIKDALHQKCGDMILLINSNVTLYEYIWPVDRYK